MLDDAMLNIVVPTTRTCEVWNFELSKRVAKEPENSVWGLPFLLLPPLQHLDKQHLRKAKKWEARNKEDSHTLERSVYDTWTMAGNANGNLRIHG